MAKFHKYSDKLKFSDHWLALVPGTVHAREALDKMACQTGLGPRIIHVLLMQERNLIKLPVGLILVPGLSMYCLCRRGT